VTGIATRQSTCAPSCAPSGIVYGNRLRGIRDQGMGRGGRVSGALQAIGAGGGAEKWRRERASADAREWRA